MKQPHKPDAATIIIYGIIALAVLYGFTALGACFQLNMTEQGKVDFVKAFNSLETLLVKPVHTGSPAIDVDVSIY